jgi:hypothetical protein
MAKCAPKSGEIDAVVPPRVARQGHASSSRHMPSG